MWRKGNLCALLVGMEIGALTMEMWLLVASLMTQLIKSLPAMQGVLTLGWEDSLKKEIATHFSILAWRIPWMSLVGYSPWGNKELDMTQCLTFYGKEYGVSSKH